MQTHFQERSLHQFEKVSAFLSIAPDRRALIFVHGYSGDALETWADFQTLIPSCPECAGCDLFFYGYDALYSELVTSAGMFRTFLERVADAPGPMLNAVLDEAAQRSPGFSYDRIVIAAHSLGAVLARWAILDALRLDAGWPAKTRSVFFAPAHSGAEVTQLAAEAFGGIKFLRPFLAGVTFRSPLIRQLARNSPELVWLAAETNKAVGLGHDSVTPRRVLIAQYERIVNNVPFCSDPPPIPVPNATHTSICKPKGSFRLPLEQLLNEL